MSSAVNHFSFPHLYEANHSAVWEHADNLPFLIPLYTLGASLEASSCPSRCGRTVSLRHKMIKVVQYKKDKKIYIPVLNLHSKNKQNLFFFQIISLTFQMPDFKYRTEFKEEMTDS